MIFSKRFICIILLVLSLFVLQTKIFAINYEKITIIKEKETIKEIKTNSEWFMGTVEPKIYKYKLTKYKIKNNTQNTYQIIRTTNFDNVNTPNDYKKLTNTLVSFDTGLTFMFTVWCPLLAPYFAYYTVKDLITAPTNAYRNIKRKKEANKASQTIIGKKIKGHSTFSFYAIYNLSVNSNEIEMLLKDPHTGETITISGNVEALQKRNKKEKINKYSNNL